MIETFVVNYALGIGVFAIFMTILLILAVFYIAFLLKRTAAVFEETSFILESLEDFRVYLDHLSKTENFFQDPTVTSMMSYTKQTVGLIEDYIKLFDYFEDDDSDDSEENDDFEEVENDQ